MADFDVETVFMDAVGNDLSDEDVSSYLCSVLSSMEIEELRSVDNLAEVVSPFLVDAGSHNEDEASAICRQLAKAFGGSGYSGGSNGRGDGASDEPELELLSAPIKLNDTVEVQQLNKKGTYITSTAQQHLEMSNEFSDSSMLESLQAPSTRAAMRKRRHDEDILNKKLRDESNRRKEAANELHNARMAVVKAARSSGGQHKQGVNIECFSLPHPNGRGELLSDAKLTLSVNRKYGLVGKNGAGKSTLLRGLALYQLPNIKHLRILLVDQHVEGDDKSPMEWVLDADVERTALLEEQERIQLYMNMNINPDNTNVKEKNSLPLDLRGVDLTLALQEVEDRMEIMEIRTAEQRALVILKGLGFTDEMIYKPTNRLSGGWAMRAALSAAIYVNPDLLLLDEPTNHLDLHALVWLEEWLINTFSGILVVVSHDSHFLDSVCSDIIDFKSTLSGAHVSSLISYNGDYSTYMRTLTEKRTNKMRDYDAYEKEKEKLIEFISREGKKYDNPSHQSQRKMKMKQLTNLNEVSLTPDDVELVLKLPKPHGIFKENEKLISIQNVSFAWPKIDAETKAKFQEAIAKANADFQGNDNNENKNNDDDEIIIQPEINKNDIKYYSPLFTNVDFVVQSKARIAILGRNGCGKTSLLNIILGSSATGIGMQTALPTTGIITKLSGCRVTMLQQHHYKGEQLDPDLSALDHIRALPQDESSAVGLYDPGSRHEDAALRTYLANFGIRRDPAILPVKYLSGGQRMRVALACAFFRKPDLLILDEPTNHLDSDTVRALCESLQKFEGAIIAVSHDEAFVNKVIVAGVESEKSVQKIKEGEIWVMENKQVKRHEGTFSSYKRKIRDEMLKKLGK
jgi:ATP-binding cassette, subfamily F, member 3